MELTKKIDHALFLLQSIPQDGPIELSYSGGKDSDVILELAEYENIIGGGLFPEMAIDTKSFLENYFGIEL